MNKRANRIWHEMNPKMQEVVAKMENINAKVKQAVAAGELSSDRHQRSREAYRLQLAPWTNGGPAAAKTEEQTLQGVHGPLLLRLYEPQHLSSKAPVVLYFHGGGNIVGDLDTHDRVMRELMTEMQAPVVGVDYPLAPMTHFPAPIDEAETLVRSLDRWGLNWQLKGRQMVLAGDSSGASIVLATALRLRRLQSPALSRILAMALFYGSYGLLDSYSMRRYGGPWDGMSVQNLAKWRRLYFDGEPPHYHEEWHLIEADYDIPLLPAFIAVSNLDPLLDDGRLIADLLGEQNPVALDIPQGVLHAYLQYSELLPEAQETLQRCAAFIDQVQEDV